MARRPSVYIDGCTDGSIGSCLARVFAQRGYRVFASVSGSGQMRDLDKEEWISQVSINSQTDAEMRSAFESVRVGSRGRLKYLILCTDKIHCVPILDLGIDAAREIFDSNVWRNVRLIQVFAPMLRRSMGTIVTISSVAAHLNTPYMGIYGASKCALELTINTLRLELAPFNVKVKIIVTGAVQTPGPYYSNFNLSPNSLYKRVEQTFVSRAGRLDSWNRARLESYADNVFTEVTRGTRKRVWLGGMAGIIWLLEILMPFWLLDRILMMFTGIDTWPGYSNQQINQLHQLEPPLQPEQSASN